MKVSTESYSPFYLLKTRNTDGHHFATRRNTRAAILAALKSHFKMAYKSLIVIRKSDLSHYYVTAEVTNGKLRLGCKSFNRAATRKIFRWAGLTPAVVTAARKARRK